LSNFLHLRCAQINSLISLKSSVLTLALLGKCHRSTILFNFGPVSMKRLGQNKLQHAIQGFLYQANLTEIESGKLVK